MKISARADTFERSGIRVMFELAEQQGGDLVRLEVGEPDFDTPEHVIDAAADAAREGKTHYTSGAGIPELRAAIAERMESETGVSFASEEVTVTNGGMEALALAILAIADPGDEVILPTPAWPNYENQVVLADAEPVKVPLPAEDGFDLDAERIIDHMNDDTAAVILTTPSNPTGRVYGEDAVKAVVDAAAEHDAYVIADEVYARLTYDDEYRRISSFTDYDGLLTVDSCSKTYAMTGWRMGWLVGPESVVEAATQVGESTTACPSSVGQQAALAAITGTQEPVREMYAAFRERRDYLTERVAEIPHISCPRPEGAFYAFLDVSELDGSSFDIAERLLSDYGVVTAPGGAFSAAGEGYLRLSFANSLDRIELGLDRIEALVRDECE
ncbi:pyridoxal phosphate-dependent aminotransferase [Haladaptatus sp. AB618]|uniref:pyridoxal phosphate-dependent aminotransferase n=1 Tax=Haladaptatus sp. AB618 TaxID=2934173 RepID=UPI00209C1053|nr:pyridoxal phosphate-dependent aminotransferase [Haladaptatus sp. AB618]MCO8254283.1 pyridoxal phosphate-dependent aminotransferase [Haladaptatus sp. AB618]